GLSAEAHYGVPLARLDIELRLATGDLAGALAAAGALPGYNPRADPRYLWPLLATAMQAWAEASGIRLPPGTGHPADVRDNLERRAAEVARLNPVSDAYAALLAAEAAQGDGGKNLPGWDMAVTAWETAGQPYPLSYALTRAAG